MAKFNLVTIIDSVEEVAVDVGTAIADFHKELASLGHKVVSATLTSDAGQTKIAVPEPVAAAPVAKAPAVNPTAPPAHIKSTLDK
jgi:hypothetical protein